MKNGKVGATVAMIAALGLLALPTAAAEAPGTESADGCHDTYKTKTDANVNTFLADRIWDNFVARQLTYTGEFIDCVN